jgi:hypothetical protein
MELLIATWTLRGAIVAALAVGGASYGSGATAVDAVDRALAVAVAFTFAGRFLLSWLEPPAAKMLRLRKRREARRGKQSKNATAETVAAAAKARRASTISRTA